MHEWPILIFTFMLTASVGLTGAIAIFGFWFRKELDEADIYAALRMPMLVASAFAIVALAASFGHVGYPLNAPNAIRHVMSSWLSREIILTCGFIGAICLTTLLALRSSKVSLIFVGGSCLIGVLAILAMGEIYRNTSVVTWMHLNTHVMFLGGMLLTGAVLGLLLVVPGTGGRVSPSLSRKLFLASAACVAVGLVIQLLVTPSYIMAINANPLNDVVTYPLKPFEVFQTYATVRCVRWILSMVGLALLIYAAWKSIRRNNARAGYPLAVGAATILFAGEVVGRYVFYAIYG